MPAPARSATEVIGGWPEESREAAQLVIDARGEPDEVLESLLVWYDAAPWKRVVATRTFYEHRFPVAHTDSVESFLDYQVPVERISDVIAFDGSVVIERTAGELSARCHDEEANFLAVNLADDIVTGERTVEEARQYYGKEFLDYRRGEPTPYMDGLRFDPPTGGTADPDDPILTDQDLERAQQEGESSP